MTLYNYNERDQFAFKDESTGQSLRVSDNCEIELSSESRNKFYISTANCPPNFLTLTKVKNNKNCIFDCNMAYTIQTTSDPDSLGYFYWSEKDSKLLLAETYNDAEEIQATNNFIETSFKEASHVSLQCSESTKQWQFIIPDQK